MAKVQRETLLKSLASVDIYQWKQGKVLRRSTAAAIVLTFLLASQALYHSVLYDMGSTGAFLSFMPNAIKQLPMGYWVFGLINILGLWIAFRAINYPVFADFLIDVESEMTKVTWPTWTELQRATIVVLCTMFLFAMLLFGYDIAWQEILKLLGVLNLKLAQ